MRDAEKFVWAGIGALSALMIFLMIGLLDQNHYLDPLLDFLGIH